MTIPAYNPKQIHPLFPRFYLCQDCPYYLDPDNYITLDGTYPVKNDVRRRQRLHCHLGKHRFSETAFWLNFELGARTSQTAHRLLRNLVYLMPWGFEHFLLITTDKLAAYEKAIALPRTAPNTLIKFATPIYK